MAMTPEERAEYERRSKENLAKLAEERKKNGNKNLLIGCLPVVIVLGVIIAVIIGIANTKVDNKKTISKSKTESTDSFVNSGAIGYIVLKGSDIAPIGTTKENIDHYMTYAVANDTNGTLNMMKQGKIFPVPNKTKALVIEYKDGYVHVRIKDGSYAGDEGWTAEDCIKKAP